MKIRRVIGWSMILVPTAITLGLVVCYNPSTILIIAIPMTIFGFALLGMKMIDSEERK